MKINCIKQFAWMACVLFSLACTNEATVDKQNGDTTNVGRSGSENRGEDFVTDVLEMNAEQTAWLREGMNNATDTEIKSTAREMVQEHEKMERDLRAYAEKRNFRTDDIDTSETVKLNKKRGEQWDEEWADEVGDRHRQLIRRFERAQKRVDDTELKNIISQRLPSLRKHLGIVEKLEARLDKNSLYPNENVTPIVQ